jgi:hypothetical protein
MSSYRPSLTVVDFTHQKTFDVKKFLNERSTMRSNLNDEWNQKDSRSASVRDNSLFDEEKKFFDLGSERGTGGFSVPQHSVLDQSLMRQISEP